MTMRVGLGRPRYFGRVWPLFRCLRAYPLMGPQAALDVNDPRKVFIYNVQLNCQTRRMQRLLNNRLAIENLLKAKLLGVVEYEPRRFEPRFDSPEDFRLASRFAVWFDGKAYRFLLFDTKADRARWLLGEDWVDEPRELEEYAWSTDEEWEQQIAEEVQRLVKPQE